MKIVFKDKNKMKNFLERYCCFEASDFDAWLEYLKECVEFIDEELPIQKIDGLVKKAYVTFDNGYSEFELCAEFVKIIDRGELVWVIDLDYSYPMVEV